MSAPLPLQDVVVLTVESVRPDGSRVGGLACLVAPDMAVTLGNVVPRERTRVLVTVPASERSERIVLEVTDVRAGGAVTVLRFPPVDLQMPGGEEGVFAPEEPSRGMSWSGRIPTMDGAIEMGGVIMSAEGEMMMLSVTTGMQARAVPPGTPIFQDDRVIGLVAGAEEGDGVLRAVSNRSMRAAVEAARRAPPETGVESEEGGSEATANRSRPSRKGRPSPKQMAEPARRPPSLPVDLFARLSASSRKALDHADGMRRAMEQSEIHMEQLILALYQKDGGPTRKELARAGIDEKTLRERLGRIAERDLPAWGSYAVPELRALPPFSPHVAEALAAAHRVAVEHGSEELQSRHLFHGVLSVPDCTAVAWMIEEFGADPGQIDMSAPPSKAGAERTVAKRARAQVSADLAEGVDLLDVKEEAEAICAIIAAHETKPPLSIGLFGDWGTGKTFFMGLMEKRIEQLKRTARKAEGSAYCANIVQLRFNAWHYIDTDLWASLTAEIFEGLARSLEADELLLASAEQPGAARTRILATTAHLLDVRAEKERLKAQADADLRASEQRLAALNDNEREIEASLDAREILKATYRVVVREGEAAKSVTLAAEKMGIPDAEQLGNDTRVQLLELRGLAGAARALLLALRNGSGRLWLLMILTLVGVPLVVGLAARYAAELRPLAAGAAAAAAAAAAFLTTIAPYLRRAVAIVGSARKASEKTIADKRRELEDARKAERDMVQERATRERAEIQRINAELAELEAQLARLRPDKQLVDFIQAKQASDDYTKHFGVIARARHDFERLSDLLKLVTGAKDGPPRDPGAAGLPPVPRIDRIVLYIDDLDRCPEAKVVDVLQAVHLLLAFPLFIVVVGVDSRWLLHSLRQHAAVFRPRDDDGLVIDEEEQVHWESTPFNYLEKIFQIPFNLRPMDGAGFAKLIDALTIPEAPGTNGKAAGQKAGRRDPGTPGTSGPGATPAATGGGSGEAGTPIQLDPANGGVATPGGGPGGEGGADGALQAEAKPEAEGKKGAGEEERHEHEDDDVDPNPPFLSISPEERAFMHEMHRLIPTPRAAKRYVNVYRLFRASLSDSRRELLEEAGSARSRQVLLMLAIVTGFPQEGAVILRELVEREPAGGWWKFVYGLAAEYTRPGEGGSELLGGTPRGNGVAPASDSERQRAQRWEELAQRLTAVREQVAMGEADPPCAEFTRWAKSVARYSFESGRVLIARQESGV